MPSRGTTQRDIIGRYIIGRDRMPCRGPPNPWTWNFRFTRSAKRIIKNAQYRQNRPAGTWGFGAPPQCLFENAQQWVFDVHDLEDFCLFSKGVEQKRMKGSVC